MSRKRKGKKKFKPRFFVFCGALVLIACGTLYFVFGSAGDKPVNAKDVTTKSQGNANKDQNEDSVPAVQDPANSDQKSEGTDIKQATKEYNTQVYNAILNSNYTAVVSKPKSSVIQTYGEVTNTEKWGGGDIFTHKKFPKSMYVGYNEKDICNIMEIPLAKIKTDVTNFEVDKDIWGKLKTDKTGDMFSDYYYEIQLSDRTIMLFAQEDGTISMGTDIFVKLK